MSIHVEIVEGSHDPILPVAESCYGGAGPFLVPIVDDGYGGVIAWANTDEQAERIVRALVGEPLPFELECDVCGDTFETDEEADAHEAETGHTLHISEGSYTPPEDVTDTVFDPTSRTFAPIMAAIQRGDFEDAAAALTALALATTGA
jgi:hypothetical protein